MADIDRLARAVIRSARDIDRLSRQPGRHAVEGFPGLDCRSARVLAAPDLGYSVPGSGRI